MAKAVADIIRMSKTDWDTISEIHDANLLGLNRTSDSLKRKFQEMARAKIPTGDPECPRHIRIAKWAYYWIVKATDGSTGEGLMIRKEEDFGRKTSKSRESIMMTK